MNLRIETLSKLFNHTTIPTDQPRGDCLHLFLLYGLARMLDPTICVEIGSQRGYSAAWTAQALKDNGDHGFLTCIDPFIGCGDGKKPIFEETMKNMGLDNFKLIEGLSQDISVRAKAPKSIDFLLIDGGHSKEACARDTKHYVPRLTSGGIVFFHDYRACPGVKEAIQESEELKGFFEFPLPTSNYWTYAAIKP
jgi:predicted O-methyltransferase YrrM